MLFSDKNIIYFQKVVIYFYFIEYLYSLEKEIIMDEKDEIDLIWICNSPINVSKKYENEEHEDNSLIDVKSSENIFPWLSKFNKIMCSSVGHRNYQLLKHLLFLYTQ